MTGPKPSMKWWKSPSCAVEGIAAGMPITPLATRCHNENMKKLPEIITAAEIAEYIYCPEAFRLKLLGHQPANQSSLAAGTSHHTRKAIAERAAAGFIAVGKWIILAALLGLAVMWWMNR